MDTSMRYSLIPQVVTLSGTPVCVLVKGNKLFRNVVEGLLVRATNPVSRDKCGGYPASTSTARWNSKDAMENYLPTAPLSVTSDGKTEDIN